MAKIAKFNYKVTLEIPRDLRTKNGSDVTVDTITQFIYDRKNKESALKAFGSTKNLRYLRKMGFDLTRTEFKKFRNRFAVERV
jgi:hypothetical protein